MEELPKIARERLQKAAPSQPPHPDADLMTAFVEGSLTGRERAQVLEHLSHCIECRAVAALALPEKAATIPRSALPKSGSGRAGQCCAGAPWPLQHW